MGNTTVRFLGENFEISDTIKEYLKYEKIFTPYVNELISDVVKIINNNSRYTPSAVIAEQIHKEFPKYYKIMDTFTDKILKKLINCGIYDVTAKDLNDNESHKNMIVNLYTKIATKATEEGQVFLQMKQMGIANAYDYASSQVTGTGFGIITNSFSSLMIYSAIEAQSILSQAKKADNEYSNAVKNITRKASDGFENMCKDLLINEFYPVIYAIYAEFANNVISSFYAYLTVNNKFDFESIKTYDMNKADEMLVNLKSAPDKKAFLKKAFLKCPFNPTLYKKCFELGYMDADTLRTAVYFDLGNEFETEIKNLCKQNLDDFTHFKKSLELYAICLNTNERTALSHLFSSKIDKIQIEYQHITSAISNYDWTKDWIKGHITKSVESLCSYDNNSLQEKISKILMDILPESIFNTFKAYDSIDVFKIPYYNKNMSLSEINQVLSSKLVNAISESIPKIKEKREVILSEYKELKQEYNCKLSEYNKIKEELIAQRNSISSEIEKLSIFSFKKKKELNCKKSEISEKISEVLKSISGLADMKNQCDKKFEQANTIV